MRKKTQQIKEKTEIPKRCSYLDEYIQNLSEMEFIDKHVCSNFQDRYEENGKCFCVFHYPNESKAQEFQSALTEKINKEHFIFNGTWFPDFVDLSWIEFNTPADFSHCFFRNGVSFTSASFLLGANFSRTSFYKKTDFNNTNFRNCDEIANIDMSFNLAIFSGEVSFISTKFEKKITFDSSKFLKGLLIFSDAVFTDDANFENVCFSDSNSHEHDSSVYFIKTSFEKKVSFQNTFFGFTTHFSNAQFKGSADFRETEVKNSILFNDATFESFARFSSKNNNHNAWNYDGLNFSSADIEKPERIFFQAISLKPDSFVNTDIRKFDFTDIKWKVKNFWLDWARFKDIAWWRDEVRARRTSYVNLEKIYRRFASFAEENNDYESASKFRFTAFDIQRITPWYGRLPVTLLWWYKWTSRYGENWLWCAVLLLALLFGVFPYFYSENYFKTCSTDRPIAASISICESKDAEISKTCSCSYEKLNYGDAVLQSLYTATLQNVDYRKPFDWRGELWIILEKIFVPLQAALLALAIRRKFMR
jgi:hypothetical protein